MSYKKTLGGDRLGSGNQMKQELHNYYRSNHNLSCSRVTSMAPGVLYPIYTNIGLTGDTFDIDLDAFMRTLPTEGPMFGAFKLQLDVFTADARLYQAILHNNTTEIGMDMNQVLLPKVELETYSEYKKKTGAFSKSSLMYYLGVAGVGQINAGQGVIARKFNALPLLTYYDIFKNYYSNKQETNAYVISSAETKINNFTSTIKKVNFIDSSNATMTEWTPNTNKIIKPNDVLEIHGTNLIYLDNSGSAKANVQLKVTGSSTNIANDNTKFIIVNYNSKGISISLEYVGESSIELQYPTTNSTTSGTANKGEVRLVEFPLKNIDLMRKRLLTTWDLGEEVVIVDDEELLPYQSVVGRRTDLDSAKGLSKNCYPMQGLVVKCYQSDMFNNWLETEWVNSITTKSAVNVTNGSFTMDALNLAKKIYNLYNRIAISGGSYDDWQLAAYGEENFGKTEKPVYHGGMSNEVMFQEVVSSVASADQPLGTLGGRGNLNSRKGGHVIVKCREHCIIMIMASLTPRLTYSQGNAWYMTNLDSMDDFHKPEFDQIGFQDLVGETMAWWDTRINGSTGAISKTSYGKQPAWIHYQTDVDKCFGDFAEEEGKGFMVLNRLYDMDESTGGIADVTTYIDPTKYNYVFAVDDITAQNFWGFFEIDVKARRKMSAHQIPNV